MLKSIKPKAPSIKITNVEPVEKVQKGVKTTPTRKEIPKEVFDPEMIFVDKYNTELNGIEQVAFNKWVKDESEKQGRDIMWDKGAYDIQGFWKNDRFIDENGHASDKWKKPNHPSFSDQSIYHGVDGYQGGSWIGKGFKASPQTIEWYGVDALIDRFASEPELGEYLFQGDVKKETEPMAIPTDEKVEEKVKKFEIGAKIDIEDPTKPVVKYDINKAAETHQKGKDFMTRWLADPITRQKFRNNMNEFHGTNEQVLGVDNDKFRKALVGVRDAKPKFMKYYDDGEHALYKGDQITYYGEPSIGTATHEHVHATKGIDRDLTNHMMKKWGLVRALRGQYPGSNTVDAIKQKFGVSSDMRAQDHLKHANYMSQNGELYPRIMEMRQFLNVVPGQEITDDMIQQIYANPKTKQAADYYTPEQLKEILNTVAANKPNNQKGPYKYLNTQEYGYARGGIRTKPDPPVKKRYTLAEMRSNANTEPAQIQEQIDILDSIDKEEFYRKQNEEAARERQMTISPKVDQSIGSKTLDVILNPITSAKQVLNHGYIPDNMNAAINAGNMERTAFEEPLSAVNPVEDVAILADAGRLASEGQYKQAGLTTLMMLPFVKSAVGKAIKRASDVGVDEGLKDFAQGMTKTAPPTQAAIEGNQWHKAGRDMNEGLAADKDILSLPVVPKEFKDRNQLANVLRKRGAGIDAYEVAEAIGDDIQTTSPTTLYRGVSTPIKPEAVQKVGRVVDYHRVNPEDLLQGNEAMVKLHDLAVNPETRRIQGIQGGNIGNSNYLHGGVWTSNTFKGADAYGRNPTGKSDVAGMVQEFTVQNPKNRSLLGINTNANMEVMDLMSKTLGKPIEQITLQESEQLLRKWGIDFTTGRGIFGDEYHFLPGFLKEGKRTYNFSDKIKVPEKLRRYQQDPEAIAPEIIRPVTKPKARSAMTDVHELLEREKEMLRSPEGRRRIEDMGLNAKDFYEALDDLKIRESDTTPTMFVPIGAEKTFSSPEVVINPKSMTEHGHALTPSNATAHEVGHLFQSPILNRFMREQFENTFNKKGFTDELLEQGALRSTKLDRQLGYDSGYLRSQHSDMPLTKAGNADYSYYKYSRDRSNSPIEMMPMAREFRQEMVDRGYLEHPYSPISTELVRKFMLENRDVRIASFADTSWPSNIRGFAGALNRIPVIMGTAGVAGAAIANQGEDRSTVKYLRGGKIIN